MEQSAEVHALGLEEVEHLLIQLQLAFRGLIEGIRSSKRITMCSKGTRPNRTHRNGIRSVPFSLNHILKALEIIDHKPNFNIKLAHFRLEALNILDILNDTFSKPLQIDLVFKVRFGIIKQVNKVLDRANSYVSPERQLTILLSCILRTVKSLYPDDLV